MPLEEEEPRPHGVGDMDVEQEACPSILCTLRHPLHFFTKFLR